MILSSSMVTLFLLLMLVVSLLLLLVLVLLLLTLGDSGLGGSSRAPLLEQRSLSLSLADRAAQVHERLYHRLKLYLQPLCFVSAC